MHRVHVLMVLTFTTMVGVGCEAFDDGNDDDSLDRDRDNDEIVIGRDSDDDRDGMG